MHGLTPLKNFHSSGLFKTWLFFSKKHFFSLKNIKKRSFMGGFAQNPWMRKMTIFYQTAWTNSFEKFRCFLKLDFSRLKRIFFLSRISKNAFFWLDVPKNLKWEKWAFFAKVQGLTPLENFDFLDFFRSRLFLSQKDSFLSRITNQRKTIVNSWVRCLENNQLVITSGFPTVNFRKW